jgi:hypothetical protein
MGVLKEMALPFASSALKERTTPARKRVEHVCNGINEHFWYRVSVWAYLDFRALALIKAMGLRRLPGGRPCPGRQMLVRRNR